MNTAKIPTYHIRGVWFYSVQDKPVSVNYCTVAIKIFQVDYWINIFEMTQSFEVVVGYCWSNLSVSQSHALVTADIHTISIPPAANTNRARLIYRYM